jgi:hypothetical protein
MSDLSSADVISSEARESTRLSHRRFEKQNTTTGSCSLHEAAAHEVPMLARYLINDRVSVAETTPLRPQGYRVPVASA